MVVVAIVVVVEEGWGKHNTVAGRNGFILSCCRVVDSILALQTLKESWRFVGCTAYGC